MDDDQRLAAETRQLILERDRRYALFPGDLFDEYAWNMMLHLFRATLEGQAISPARLFELAHTDERIGRRWLDHLQQDGQVEPHRNVEQVTLTPAAITRLRAYCRQVLEDRAAPE